MSGIARHLPILQVVVPLVGAVLVGFIQRASVAFAIALAVSWTMPLIAAALLWQVLAGGPISYHIGGWAPPWGIEYRVDVLNAFVLMLVSGIAAIVTPYAHRSVAFEVDESRQPWFYCMYLLCLTGLLGIAVTGDAFNAFVFLEISSLSTYVLIALGRDRRALLAAFQYLIMGTIGATFYVIGIGFLYVMTGTLNIADLAARLGPAAAENSRPVVAGLAFIAVGLSLKAALFPLHAWLPNAYTYAPSVATAFLAATATKVAIYLLLRFVFAVFGVSIDLRALPVAEIIIALSLAAIFIASTVAVFETNVKRMFAFSSVSQIGYITLGIGLANKAALTGAIVHLFNHAMLKGGVFLALGAIFMKARTVNLTELAGVGAKMPLTVLALAIAGFGLVGTPGTAGFISKWYLVLGALENGSWIIAALIVASSVISLVYVARVIEIAWFRAPAASVAEAGEPPLAMLLPLLALALAAIYFGFETDASAGIAAKAADLLLQGQK